MISPADHGRQPQVEPAARAVTVTVTAGSRVTECGNESITNSKRIDEQAQIETF